MNKLVEEIKTKNEPIDARFFATKEFRTTLGLVAGKNGTKSLNECIKYIGKNLNLNKATVKGIQRNYYDYEGSYFDCFVKSYHETVTENQTPEELTKLAEESKITEQVIEFKEKYQKAIENKSYKEVKVR